MSRSRVNILAVLPLSVAAFACEGDTPVEPVNLSGVAGSYAVAAEFEVERAAIMRLGRALAMALDSRDMRESLARAVRRSSWDESQIRLQEFVSEKEGSVLLLRGATAIGESANDLLEDLNRLPAMALVMHRSRREDYMASEPLTVVAALNVETGPFFVYDGKGNETIIDAPHWTGAVLTLAPEERRMPTNARSSSSASAVVSDARYGASVSHLYVSTGSIPSGSKRLNLVEYTFCDGDFGAGGDNELVVKAYFYGEDGKFAGYGEYYDAEAPVPFDCYDPEPVRLIPSATLINHAIPATGGHWVRVEVWEDDCDCFGNNDDFYGSWIYTDGESGVIKTHVYANTNTPQYVRVQISWAWLLYDDA